MKTKNIFKALAMAMLMPAMLLTTACSNEDDIVNNENTIKKGFELPVTVNVTREGDATTRATYNDNGNKTGSLGFSSGDKLLVKGLDNGGKQFAGILTWQSGGTFSGTITTENTSYSGTADDLLKNAVMSEANLLPAGYDSKGFIIVSGSGYQMNISYDWTKAFALTKAEAVEQLSKENAGSYSSGTGFALAPSGFILNFTITGLTPSTEVAVAFTKGTTTTSGNVTTDGSGNATFAISTNSTNIGSCTLTVGGNNIALPSTALAIGKIYNITRSAALALTYPIALGDATSDYVGSVVTTDGNVYATVAAASAASKTAVAVIAYVGTAGSVDASSASYKGLAIAMSDAGADWCQWYPSSTALTCVSQYNNIADAIGHKDGISNTNALTTDGHTHAAATAAASNNSTAAPTGTSGWFLPSMGQWNLIVQGLATKQAGSAVTTDITTSENNTYKASNLNSVITDAGGTGFRSSDYHSSTLRSNQYVWVMKFSPGRAADYGVDTNNYVRSVLAF